MKKKKARNLCLREHRSNGRRLIKIARTRFGGIAAAAVGRFSTTPATPPFVPLPGRNPLPRRLYIPPVASIPLQPALFPTLYHPSPPFQPSRPRLARPFGVVYASGIQMTAFARAEECPTISAWLRSPTTKLQRGIRSLISFFPLLRHATDPATCYCVPTPHPYSSICVTDRTFPLYTSRIFSGTLARPACFINPPPATAPFRVSMNSIKLFRLREIGQKIRI